MMLPRLHVVTDDAVVCNAAFVAQATAVLETLGPVVAFHLRGHHVSGRTLYAIAERLAPAARAAGALLLANDRIDIALAAKLDGVQLGVRSLAVDAARALLPAASVVGYSAHAAREAASVGADFIVFGTVFDSPSHPGQAAAGIAALADAAAIANVPVVAIGGITADRVAAALQAGAYGVAVLSGVWTAREPVASALDYASALNTAVPVPS